MERRALSVVRALPAIIQNTHLDVTLAGWPAAVAVTALCVAAVAIFSPLVKRG